MNLPPLTNLFAVSHEDSAVLRELAAEMRHHGDFTEVWHPADGWVVGATPLPGSQPDGEFARRSGFAFVEGRDLVEERSRGDLRSLFCQVAEWARESPERLVALPGDFGFAHFRPAGEATLVRSCGGLVPIYYGFLQGRVAIGTRLSYFVRYLPDGVPIDPLVNALWSVRNGVFPDRRTFLAGVSILGCGRFARIREGRWVEIGRYWHPQPKTLPTLTPTRQREHAERLRSLLIRKLERDLDPEGGNLLTLSGGVDSSALAALAAGFLGRKISTWSLVPHPEELYQREMSYIRPLAEQFGFAQSWVQRLTQQSRIKMLGDAPSIVFYVIHPALCALPRLGREASIKVLFGGEFADMVCGSELSVPDWLAHHSLIDLLGVLGPRPLTPRALLSWAKRFWTSLADRPTVPYPNELPGFIRPELRGEYQAWYEHRRHIAGQDRGPLRFLEMLTDDDEWVVQNWEAASAVGVRRSLPFFHREVIELAFDCHPSELIGPGDKKLLRAALANDVPVRNLKRADKGGWGAYLRAPGTFEWDSGFSSLMAPVVQPDWWHQAPKHVDYWEAFHLTLLLKFESAYRQWRCGIL